jgi:hypothetical protein
MAIKYENLVVQFNPGTVTAAQLQAQINTYSNQGWQFIQAMLVTSTKAFALFIKELAQ